MWSVPVAEVAVAVVAAVVVVAVAVAHQTSVEDLVVTKTKLEVLIDVEEEGHLAVKG
jgi:hypothetical protein